VLAWAAVAEVATADAIRTQQMGMANFEDALQFAAAERCGAKVIVTRNLDAFVGKTAVRVVLPEDYVDEPPEVARI